MAFKHYKQHDAMDCGPTSLRMIASYYGREYSLESLRESCFITKGGVNLQGISTAAEKIGFRTLGVKVPLKKLVNHSPFPCILHWNQNHFVVLYKVKNGRYYIADPASGLHVIDEVSLSKNWLGESTEGIALLLEPTPYFYENTILEKEKISKKGFRYLFGYIRPYKRHIVQLLLSMIAGTALSLIFPFLTQALVDYGISKRDLGFVELILISQLLLFVGTMAIEMIRSWLMLHMNARINISLISDFLMKLMKLPVSFFDTRQIGDIKQRIGDHARVQTFLTGPALSTIFSTVNLLVFAVVMAIFSVKILVVFLIFSIVGVLWILLFLRRRKTLDYLRFQQASTNENVMYELISGIQEIKLNNCETTKRWGWERVQAKLFALSIKGLALGQTQGLGSSFFNQLKNILISYISAREVIQGNMTLGMMMSISYIVGQLNTPIQQLLGFIQSAQDAKISLDRLSEIHAQKEEEQPGMIKNIPLANTIGEHSGLSLNSVSFQYGGPGSPFALKDINVVIPKGKITAIVGTSGSGKTTLMKLLLKYYEPTAGNITIDGNDLKTVSPSWWRDQCGTVMQEGYIFNDTIAGNIALSDEDVDYEKLRNAVTIANIKEFIDELPMGYHTHLGFDGLGISAGQKQRILIARAIYKDPMVLLFDEATNTLDANNESIIMKNLEKFFTGRTAIVIAHRLSTVKNADQIIVLEKAQLVEKGTHIELVKSKGKYYELVKNQLEL